MRALLCLVLLLPMTSALAGQTQPTPQAYTLSPARRAQAVAYAHSRHWNYFLDTAATLVALASIRLSRISARLRAWSPPVVLAALMLIELPFDARSHVLAVRYGQSLETWSTWLADWAQAQAIVLPLTAVGLWALYALMRRSPQRWWFYAWLFSIPFSIASVYLEPLWIAPLFNHFEPLAKSHPALVLQMEKILVRARVSIPRERMFEMKASEKTTSLNAYVSGFGASQRVVLYDTIIAAETPPQLMTTFGHELGHYALHHIAWGLLFASALSLSGLFTVHRLLRLFLNGPADWASLPLLLLLFATGAFLADPVVNGFSRHQEHAADVYSLDITHDNQAAAQAFQVEGDADLSDPDPSPFIRFWLYSHPPTADRLRFALEYNARPW